MQGHLSAACKVAFFWNDGSEPLRHNKGQQSLNFSSSSKSNGGLREGNPQVMALSHIMVVKFNKRFYGLFNRTHLNKSHFPIFLEEFKAFHGASILSEKLLDIFFTYRGRYV